MISEKLVAFVIDMKVRCNMGYNSKGNCESQMAFMVDLTTSVKWLQLFRNLKFDYFTVL